MYLIHFPSALDGDSDRIQQLLSKGTSVNATDNAGYTALHYAARAGNVRICELLIQAGANVNMATKAGQATPLHRAAMAGKIFVKCTNFKKYLLEMSITYVNFVYYVNSD